VIEAAVTDPPWQFVNKTGKVAPEPVAAKLHDLLIVELQLGDPQLQQLTPYPQPAQSQMGVFATSDDNLE